MGDVVCGALAPPASSANDTVLPVGTVRPSMTGRLALAAGLGGGGGPGSDATTSAGRFAASSSACCSIARVAKRFNSAAARKPRAAGMPGGGEAEGGPRSAKPPTHKPPLQTCLSARQEGTHQARRCRFGARTSPKRRQRQGQASRCLRGSPAGTNTHMRTAGIAAPHPTARTCASHSRSLRRRRTISVHRRGRSSARIRAGARAGQGQSVVRGAWGEEGRKVLLQQQRRLQQRLQVRAHLDQRKVCGGHGRSRCLGLKRRSGGGHLRHRRRETQPAGTSAGGCRSAPRSCEPRTRLPVLQRTTGCGGRGRGRGQGASGNAAAAAPAQGGRARLFTTASLRVLDPGMRHGWRGHAHSLPTLTWP